MIACGHYPAFSRAQGVDNIHPGDRLGTGAIAQKSPALSPRCTQIPGAFAQVIHKFVHREARLAEAPTGNALPANKTQLTRVRGPAPAARGDLGQGRQAAASARGRACRPEITGGLHPAGDLGSGHGRSPQRAPSATTMPVSEGIRHAASRTRHVRASSRSLPSAGTAGIRARAPVVNTNDPGAAILY
jgi:hypothetical protein